MSDTILVRDGFDLDVALLDIDFSFARLHS